MTEKVARIVWLSADQGGRKSVPTGPRYSAPICLESNGVSSADGATWSLVTEMIGQSADAMEWTAKVRFLVAEAPNHLLTDGTRFDYYEGKKCVGHGVVLPTALSATLTPQTMTSPQEARH